MHGHEATHSTPRWVRVSGITIVLLLLLTAGLHLIGGNLPGHAFGGHGNHASPSSAAERGPQ